jgi:hypothetical protein
VLVVVGLPPEQAALVVMSLREGVLPYQPGEAQVVAVVGRFLLFPALLNNRATAVLVGQRAQ